MAIDNGNYVAGMNINIPANTDPRYEGAAQIRAVKRMVQDSFPNIDGEVTADVATLNYMTDGTQGRFIGETTMFQGLPEDIPDGWVLSDGTIQNGYQTMDLRSRFIMGYNDTLSTTEPIRSTGGDNHPTLTDHLVSEAHTLDISQMPTHSHDIDTENYFDTAGNGQVSLGGGTVTGQRTTYEVGGSQPHSHDLTATLESDDTTPTFDNRPEYVVLAYIVYVGKTV